jgi:hypothetical protein
MLILGTKKAYRSHISLNWRDALFVKEESLQQERFSKSLIMLQQKITKFFNQNNPKINFRKSLFSYGSALKTMVNRFDLECFFNLH